VIEERLRIARDLHDVVAHHMSAIVIQSAVAREAIARDPGEAARAVESIETNGRAALNETRRVLGVLRQSRGADDRTPAPGLSDLDRLYDVTEQAGVDVDSAVSGEPRSLTPAEELVVYRIIQEALTNVVKHAPGSRAQVSLAYESERLRLEVKNPATSPAQDSGEGGGNGIIGMQERAAGLGGSLTAGRTTDGVFKVAASIPLEGRE